MILTVIGRNKQPSKQEWAHSLYIRIKVALGVAEAPVILLGMSHSPSLSRGRRRRRRSRLTLWPRARLRRRLWRAFQAIPPDARLLVGGVIVVMLWFVLNGVYQVVRKPAELFFPMNQALSKTPLETWNRYESLFRRHATSVITPEFLAALAQAEASGNPVATSYWRWTFTWDPFELYRPASSAVGLYQLTDGTYAEAKRYCIHNNAVVEDGPWHAWDSCWFNSLYSRVVPTHAVEMTSALLDRQVAQMLERFRLRATLTQKQELAAVIHLCGYRTGEGFARRGFRLFPNQRCGDHDAQRYLNRINSLKAHFARLGRQA